MFKVFTRNWYKADGTTPDHNARKLTVGTFNTEDKARECCRIGNADRPAAWIKRSRKYEYTSC